MTPAKIVLFDGVCNFCNAWVRFIFKQNKKRDIFFVALQDEKAKSVLPPDTQVKPLSSIVFYKEGNIYTQSTAALRIGIELNMVLKIVCTIGLLIPKFIRDKTYNFIARNRYKWFGKIVQGTPDGERCPIPSAELQKQFL